MTKAKEIAIEKFRKDPVLFAEILCGTELTDYQKEMIRDEHKRVIFCCGRQVGKTTVTSIKALWRAYCFDNQDIMIISATERQAEIVYRKIMDIVLANPIIRRDVNRLTMRRMEFKNGSIIRCLPAGVSGETIRGYTCDMVIVDEAQSVNDDVFVSIMPALMVKRGQLILMGTPSKGKTGFFWKAWIDDEFSKHRVPSVASPFISKDEVEVFRRIKGEIAFKREILAEFVDADDAFFDLDLVKNAMILKRKTAPQEGYIYYMGIDWARYGSDYNAVVVVGIDENGEEIAEMHNFWIRGKRPMNDVIGWIVNKIEKWKPLYVYADATGGWGAAVDRLREALEEKKIMTTVKDFNFSKHNLRRELYWNLRRMIEDNKLKLIDDDGLFEQFDSFKIKYSSTGQEQIKKEGEHDDVVDALALACWTLYEGGQFKWTVGEFINVDELFGGGFI